MGACIWEPPDQALAGSDTIRALPIGQMRKKCFHCSFVKYGFLESPETPPHASVKLFLRSLGIFFPN